MHLLTEKEEDAYLQSAEIAEEVVKSVDYDVWLCDACKATRVLPYASAFTTYKKCPNCGAKTYKLERDEVAVQATTLHAGQGEKVYECQHCKFKKVVPYVIPMIVVAAAVGRSGGAVVSEAALAVEVVLVAVSVAAVVPVDAFNLTYISNKF